MKPIETERSLSYRKLTAKEIEDIDYAIDAIWKQSAKVPLKLLITGKPMPDNSVKQPENTSL
jgi:hypothetical protein